MCLSNIYRNEVNEELLLFRNIADVRVEDGRLLLTDLMGIRSEVEGTIEKIDLMDNYIIIRDNQ